jgi:hypothetical protein
MRWVFLLPVVMAGGCAAYTDTQMRLVEQARSGLALCREAQDQRSQLVEQFHQLQRKRLDEAFDEDVKARDGLAADWVIEHRRAYAAALEAMGTQREASHKAEEAAKRNLTDIDRLLEQLLMLQGIQKKLTSWESATQPAE